MRTEVIIRATRTQNVLGKWAMLAAGCWHGSALQGIQTRELFHCTSTQCCRRAYTQQGYA